MAKKAEVLSRGINSLLGSIREAAEQQEPTLSQEEQQISQEARAKRERENLGGRPRSNFRVAEKASQEGCKENETRATFIVSEPLLAQFKEIAYWQRWKVKDAANMMLSDFIEKYGEEAKRKQDAE